MDPLSKLPENPNPGRCQGCGEETVALSYAVHKDYHHLGWYCRACATRPKRRQDGPGR